MARNTVYNAFLNTLIIGTAFSSVPAAFQQFERRSPSKRGVMMHCRQTWQRQLCWNRFSSTDDLSWRRASIRRMTCSRNFGSGAFWATRMSTTSRLVAA